jgi:hypothetical protein
MDQVMRRNRAWGTRFDYTTPPYCHNKGPCENKVEPKKNPGLTGCKLEVKPR